MRKSYWADTSGANRTCKFMSREPWLRIMGNGVLLCKQNKFLTGRVCSNELVAPVFYLQQFFSRHAAFSGCRSTHCISRLARLLPTQRAKHVVLVHTARTAQLSSVTDHLGMHDALCACFQLIMFDAVSHLILNLTMGIRKADCKHKIRSLGMLSLHRSIQLNSQTM